MSETPRCPPLEQMACVRDRSLCTFPRCVTEPLGKFKPWTDEERAYWSEVDDSELA